MHIAIVGAGLTGAVLANRFSAAGHRVTVFESRPHIAGNCYTERDPATGVLVHSYGPHIFHTNDERTWSFINSFGKFMPYVNRVKAVTGGRVYTLPINLLTINQFFGKTFSPAEAKTFIDSLGDHSITNPISFEDQALRYVGQDLYDAFFKGYTRKQWGIEPSKLPASILKRLPVRFNYDDNYFSHKFQGMPVDGYSPIVERMLEAETIEVHLGVTYDPAQKSAFDHTFFSGPLDSWFGYAKGRLGYRTLDFELIHADGDFQGNAVINHCDESTPYTRITEHKHFAPWEHHDKTVCFREFSRTCDLGDIPYYPIRLTQEKTLLRDYIEMAETESAVTFVGRLGTYRYLDMDVTIKEALETADKFLQSAASGERMPVFLANPIG